MRIIGIFFFTVIIIFSASGQKVKTITKESFLTIEEYSVLKPNKNVRNGTYIKKMKYDGEILVNGNYNENRKIGIWDYYDFRTWKLEQKYDYDNNLIVYSEPSFLDRTVLNHFNYNGEWIFDELDSLPILIGGISDLKLQLTEEACNYTKVPNFPKAGIAIFSFIITKDGKTRDYKILNSSGNTFENKLLKFLMEHPGNWLPAMHHGEYVDTEFFIPMNIRYIENSQELKRFTIDFNSSLISN